MAKKKVSTFIKDSILTGIVVIVPLVVIGVALSGVIEKLVKITDPLTDIMTLGGTISRTLVATIVIAVGLAVFFFTTGFILNTYYGHRFRDWLEKTLTNHIPFFKTISGVTKQLAGVNNQDYKLVEVDLYGNNNKVFGLQTDILKDGRLVVFTPYAPVINVGQVFIVDPKNVIYLDIPFMDATDIIGRLGFQSSDVYKKAES